MPHATCAHCNCTIADHSTMVERGGQSFCCNNCATAASGMGQPGAGGAVCAHCQAPIIDQASRVERDGQTFCCNNCAMAMAQGAGHQMGGRP